MYAIKTCMIASQRRMKTIVKRCIYVQQYYLHKMGRMSAISFFVCDWIFNTPITLCLSYQAFYVIDAQFPLFPLNTVDKQDNFLESKVLMMSSLRPLLMLKIFNLYFLEPMLSIIIFVELQCGVLHTVQENFDIQCSLFVLIVWNVNSQDHIFLKRG